MPQRCFRDLGEICYQQHVLEGKSEFAPRGAALPTPVED
jgi:hypothetical protein